MIKRFKSFNESMYSMAARLVPQYTAPTSGNNYVVNQAMIKFRDETILIFDIYRENYNDDKVNFILKDPKNSSLQSLYIQLYGNSIQMEDYREYVFVRCWNNEIDFLENDWSGYIFKSESDNGFHEIDIKFSINNKWSDDQYHNTNEFFRSKVFDNKETLKSVLTSCLNEIPNVEYSQIKVYKRKLQSYLLGLDESKNINLFYEKIDRISIISIIYAIQLKDESTLKNLGRISMQTLLNCPVTKLLDTLF